MQLIELVRLVQTEGVTDKILDVCSKDEIKLILHILEEFEEHGTSKSLDSLWTEDFDEKPVSIDEFLTDPYYMGRVGQDVFPLWRDELRKVCSPLRTITEWIIKGGIGCVTGDTKIPLLDGTSPSISELVGREVWVYSVDTESNRIEVKLATNIRKTGVSVPVYELELDDKFLYVSCWGTGELRQYDVSDPHHPKLTGTLNMGGIAKCMAHPKHPDRPLNGGPQMAAISLDGKRVYSTNSLQNIPRFLINIVVTPQIARIMIGNYPAAI